MSNKIGRNEQCPCGSGIKFKKCCWLKPSTSLHNGISNHSGTDIVVLNTTTNETYMPIRLYYEVYNLQELTNKLQNLKCITFNDENNFIFNYTAEAQNFGLSVKHNNVPKDLYPIILAYGTFQDDAVLTMDLRSFKRGARMIEFIDSNISREIIKITHIATYNRITKINRVEAPTFFNENHHNELFNCSNMEIIESSDFESDFQNMNSIEDQQARAAAALMYTQKILETEISETRKVPVYYYEDGIASVESMLTIIEAYAHARFRKSSMSMRDFLSTIFDANDDEKNRCSVH